MLHRTRKQDDPNQGKWIGIGGKIESGETPDDCMKREIIEETGLTPVHYTYCGIVDFSSGAWQERMHLYTVDDFAGTLHACSEGDLQWVSDDDMLSLPMWEGDRFFLRKLWCQSPFFHLKLVYDGETLLSAEEQTEQME